MLGRVRPVLLIVAAYIAGVVPYWDFTVDDTFIHLQFTKNLLNGQGFSFNPGEPTYGSTSPMWVFLLWAIGRASPLLHMSPDLFVDAKVLTWLFGVASVVVFYMLARRLISGPVIAFAASLAFALGFWFRKFSSLGMETSLAIFLILLAVYLYFRERQNKEARPWSSLVLALGVLVRPEFVLALALSLIAQLVVGWGNRIGVAATASGDRGGETDGDGGSVPAIGKAQRGLPVFGVSLRLRRFLLACGFAAVVVGPWVAYADASFGTVVPNTVVVKALEPGFASSRAMAIETVKVLGSTDAIAILLLGLGLVVFVARAGLKRAFAAAIEHLLPIGWLVGLPVAYIVRAAPVNGRYLLPMIPFLVLYAFVAVDYLLRGGFLSFVSFRAGPGRREGSGDPHPNPLPLRRARGQDDGVREQDSQRERELDSGSQPSTLHPQPFSLPVWGVVAVVTLAILAESALASYLVDYPWNANYMDLVKNTEVYTGKWLKDNTPPDASIAAYDIGAIAFYSDRKVVDIVGLANPEVIAFNRQNRLADYLQQVQPDYIILSAANPGPDDAAKSLIRARYEPVYSHQHAGIRRANPEPYTVTLYYIDWKK